ncbi:FAD-dependent oxidoreductase [Mucilaginibacter ginsenosidivorans]|uniref:FAD-dependent oxidoreductase n=1 Tax=Mucilaginibacter ginsenosidivorans TaxID=398053 RepID=A0A5B8UTA6_9SPHI|nr:FAD-dependent oxidoreductase [Mucilaginibacter ginsenosidivorans]QEC62234.1 FAD-dependent oxidoreductase [Mucilaginibacter ginsenosidivorans]
MKGFLLICLFLPLAALSQTGPAKTYDICVYGATSGGVIAAYTAAAQGKKVILIATGSHVGGLSSGGLGYTDIGNKYVVTGLALDFYRRVGQHYGKLEQWIFEPHVAEDIFRDYLKRHNITVIYGHSLTAVDLSIRKFGIRIRNLSLHPTLSNKKPDIKIAANQYIDCSYEGDLMAKARVKYTVGREANSQYNETYDGVELRDKHQFADGVDPYKVLGDPKSGLLWGISSDTLKPNGTGDHRVQTYNVRVCLSNDPANSIPITRPADYDSTHYELYLRMIHYKAPTSLPMYISMMPNHKTDINNNGAFSTDMIGVNYDYPDGDEATREKIIQLHKNYTQGLFYFLGHDQRVPENIRRQMLQWGYPKDEYTDNGNWTSQIYVREARRMIGRYVMMQANCEGKITVNDGIAMAAYTMDSHNAERIVTNGMVKNEGDVQVGGFGPYPISYRAITPTNVTNLLVPVCLSASHIAYGSIRMEPVFMVLSQSAAQAAVYAIDHHTTVQKVNVTDIRKSLRENPLADGRTPDILLDDNDSKHVKTNGKWTVGHGGYGPTVLISDTTGSSIKTVKYSHPVTKSGAYKIYTYSSSGNKTPFSVNISTGSVVKNLTINPADTEIEGQTSGEWTSLGEYQLKAGKAVSIKISTIHPADKIEADAVLLVPGR